MHRRLSRQNKRALLLDNHAVVSRHTPSISVVVCTRTGPDRWSAVSNRSPASSTRRTRSSWWTTPQSLKRPGSSPTPPAFGTCEKSAPDSTGPETAATKRLAT